MGSAASVVMQERTSILHIVRTTTAALASQLIAQALRTPEPYWATVTTIVIMQSSLGAAWSASWKRLAGTALGALVAGFLASYFGASLIAFGAAMVGTGLICMALHLDRTAFRFAGITLSIVMLVARAQTAWNIAAHRFIEVTLGIAVGLLVTVVWPERRKSVV